MLKNKKIFFILLLTFLFLITFFTSNTKAYTVNNIDFGDVPLPDDIPVAYVLYQTNYGGDRSYALVYAPISDFSKIMLKELSVGYCLEFYSKDGNSTVSIKRCYFNPSTSSWDVPEDINKGFGFSKALSSNYDIFDNSGNVFFQKAPLLTKMAQVVQESKPEETLKEIVGILPLILVVVVSLIGLHKALSMLFRLLRQS